MVATAAGAGSALAGSALGLVQALRGLVSGGAESRQWPWHVPGGAFHVQLDVLSAFFLVPIFVLSAAAAVYVADYMIAYRDRKS